MEPQTTRDRRAEERMAVESPESVSTSERLVPRNIKSPTSIVRGSATQSAQDEPETKTRRGAGSIAAVFEIYIISKRKEDIPAQVPKGAKIEDCKYIIRHNCPIVISANSTLDTVLGPITMAAVHFNNLSRSSVTIPHPQDGLATLINALLAEPTEETGPERTSLCGITQIPFRRNGCKGSRATCLASRKLHRLCNGT